jgi:broad specificity phosphatase PhoE
VGKLYVVRHADAGSRSAWSGPDAERPLSDRGVRQAEALVEQLADAGLHRLVSSPYARCRQTLEPLARHLGLTVEDDDRLAEGAGADAVLELAAEVGPGPAAVCSHGDVIPDLLDVLVAAGLRLRDDLRWQKASTWVLHGDGRRFTKGRYLPPPA